MSQNGYTNCCNTGGCTCWFMERSLRGTLRVNLSFLNAVSKDWTTFCSHGLLLLFPNLHLRKLISLSWKHSDDASKRTMSSENSWLRRYQGFAGYLQITLGNSQSRFTNRETRETKSNQERENGLVLDASALESDQL